ncbi:MAG: hypothetical protein PHW62_07620, partial [Candidatus Ratteibacteria bacterium]|nr:hypothetical protein [Candidatus Ratteibacteria bacterium]
AYYEAIRSVSQNDMDLTSWLEYFVEGLQLQISKIREKAEDIILLELLIKQLGLCELSDCQEQIIGYIFFKGGIDNEKCQKLCRLTKTLSARSLASMVKKNLIQKRDDKNVTSYVFSDLVLGMIKDIKKHR